MQTNCCQWFPFFPSSSCWQVTSRWKYLLVYLIHELVFVLCLKQPSSQRLSMTTIKRKNEITPNIFMVLNECFEYNQTVLTHKNEIRCVNYTQTSCNSERERQREKATALYLFLYLYFYDYCRRYHRLMYYCYSCWLNILWDFSFFEKKHSCHCHSHLYRFLFARVVSFFSLASFARP